MNRFTLQGAAAADLSPETRHCTGVMSLCYTTPPGAPPLHQSYVTLLHYSTRSPAFAPELCHFVTQLHPETRL
jgi:hypothetical protein